MQEIPIFQVDAFTSKAFGGNPAAICPVEHFPDSVVMQSVARENNLSETAFIVPRDGEEASYDLRWFTPTVEVDLCGHATLGAGHIISRHVLPDYDGRISFYTRSGLLWVEKRGDRYAMSLPNLMPRPVDIPEGLGAAMGAEPVALYHRGRDYLIVYEDRAMIEAMTPDFKALKAFAPYGFVATAPASGDVDFVSRCFFPNHGILEDPVTGSAHCLSAPFWAQKLGRDHLHALQLSSRGGEIWLEVAEDHIVMIGHVVETMRGMLLVS